MWSFGALETSRAPGGEQEPRRGAPWQSETPFSLGALSLSISSSLSFSFFLVCVCARVCGELHFLPKFRENAQFLFFLLGAVWEDMQIP